jgi:5-methylcytosine-specific restriction endonuclease McrA
MRLPSQVAFYHTAAWLKCREAYIAKVGGLCERCAAKGIIRTGDIVHHKEWISEQNINDPEVLLSFDNLEYLCIDCHNGEHYGKSARRYKVDASGKIQIID